MKLLVIFNPRAGFGRSRNKLAQIRARFSGQGINADFLATEHPGHGMELVAGADLAAYDGLVAAGGDGTLFEVLNGLYRHPQPDRIPMGVLPIGTGNAFARDLGLRPMAWSDGIDLLQRARTRRVDVGRVRSPETSYYFLNVVAMGFAVKAGQTALKLKFLGDGAYTLATLWQVLKLESLPLELEADGETIRQDNIFVTVSNTSYTGTHFRIAPRARLDDGMLDLTLLEKLPRRRLLRLFPSIYKGRHVRYREVHSHQARHITIRSPGGLQLAPDGEFKGFTPAQIDCLHQDMEIFY